MNPVAIFAATRWEIHALQRALPIDRTVTINGVPCSIGQCNGRTYWIVRTGIGPQAACRVAERLLTDQALSVAVSAGFACALTSAQVGDLLVADDVRPVGKEVVPAEGSECTTVCDRAVTSEIMAAAERVLVPVHRGKVLSSSAVVWRAKDKRELSRVPGAIGLDMESAALGSIAARHGVPFVVARTLSDLVDEELPFDFNLFLRPAGWAKGVWSLVTQPSSVIGLNRLRIQSRIASDRLTEVVTAWAAEWSGPASQES